MVNPALDAKYTPKRFLASTQIISSGSTNCANARRLGRLDDFDNYFLCFIFAILKIKSVAKVRERPAVAKIRPYK